jgi:hypothetical protein
VNRGQTDFYVDLIQGDYILKKNGKIELSSTGKDATITSGGFLDKKMSLTTIRFIFTDLGKKSNRGIVKFELLGDPDKAKWILTNTEHIGVGNEHYDPTFSVPRHMIFKRED